MRLQITLTGFVLFFIIAMTSMVSSQITCLHERRRQKAAVDAALAAGSGGSMPHGATSPLGLASSVDLGARSGKRADAAAGDGLDGNNSMYASFNGRAMDAAPVGESPQYPEDRRLLSSGVGNAAKIIRNDAPAIPRAGRLQPPAAGPHANSRWDTATARDSGDERYATTATTTIQPGTFGRRDAYVVGSDDNGPRARFVGPPSSSAGRGPVAEGTQPAGGGGDGGSGLARAVDLFLDVRPDPAAAARGHGGAAAEVSLGGGGAAREAGKGAWGVETPASDRKLKGGFFSRTSRYRRLPL